MPNWIKNSFPVLLFCAFLAQFAYGETAPSWVDESWRDAQYPLSRWYIGFSQDILKSNAKLGESLTFLERDAQNKMVESISVRISSKTTTETASNLKEQGKNISETIDQNYKQRIQTSVNTEIAKAEVRSYHDKKTGRIYAFAAVKKSDLADFYSSKIKSIFSFADKEFSLAEELIEQGKKKLALDKIHAILDSLTGVNYWGSLLYAVESNNFYVEREKTFWQKASKLKMQLQNGTAVYLDISGKGNYRDLGEQLGAQMQNNNCNCTIAEKKRDAEYLVAIKTSLNRCNENPHGEVYCYANATVTVNSPKYKKPVNVKIPEAKGSWTHGNKNKATEEAFKELVNSLAEQIIPAINQ